MADRHSTPGVQSHTPIQISGQAAAVDVGMTSQAVLSTIISTRNARYFFISSWAAALAPLIGIFPAALWWCAAMSLGALRGRFENFVSSRGMYGLQLLPMVAMLSGVPWAIAPWLAWTSHSALGEVVAVLMLSSGYQLAFVQLGHRPKSAILVTAPYSVVALAIGVTLWGKPGVVEYAIALPLLYGQLAFTVIYVKATQSRIDAGVQQQAALIKDLEQARDLADAASRAKSAFLGVVSHELRTPMNGVLGAAQLLQQTRLDTSQTEFVSMIRDSGGVLLTLLNDILDVTKIEGGRMTLDPIEVDMFALIDGLAPIWSACAAEKSITYAYDIDPQIPALVWADPTRLSQILHNLLSNAIKFTQAGEVRLTISATPRGDSHADVEITVQDTGMGISAEDTTRLFQPFTQLDTRIARDFQGAGLGLSISKRLAHAMGGDITVVSEPGVGSAFTLNLTVEVVAWEMDERREDEGAYSDPPSRTVLVVEDHPTNRKILEVSLGALGHSVFTAENGSLAVELCGLQVFDLVLMDINMPVMDGLTATRAIRDSCGPNCNVPIVIVSASARFEDQSAGRDAGADAHINKPIDLSKMASVVDRAGGGRMAFQTGEPLDLRLAS
jgi:signal transduction histidine kinase/CheY-like chemotaxis protein